MLPCFQGTFTLHVDTSACSTLADSDPLLHDTWYFRDLVLQSGHVYGLVSEYGQGCEGVSYLLGGKTEYPDVNIRCGDMLLNRQALSEAAWMLEPQKAAYGRQRVRRAVEGALSGSADFAEIAELFHLTAERSDRRFIHLSGERWRAAAALGYAMHRKIFFAPYCTSMFYRQICSSGFSGVLDVLRHAGAVILLPAGSDAFLRQIADQVLYLDPQENDVP